MVIWVRSHGPRHRSSTCLQYGARGAQVPESHDGVPEPNIGISPRRKLTPSWISGQPVLRSLADKTSKSPAFARKARNTAHSCLSCVVEMPSAAKT